MTCVRNGRFCARARTHARTQMPERAHLFVRIGKLLAHSVLCRVRCARRCGGSLRHTASASLRCGRSSRSSSNKKRRRCEAPFVAQSFSSHSDAVPLQMKVAKVDGDGEKDLGERFAVRGFPTIKLWGLRPSAAVCPSRDARLDRQRATLISASLYQGSRERGVRLWFRRPVS